MPSHLYCLVPSGGEAAAPADLAVRTIAVGDIVAWVGSTDEQQLSREGRRAAARALEHDRVIGRALAQGVTPVPATLADPYADDASLERDLTRRSGEIRDALSRVAGTVEMAVILARSATESDARPAPTTGRAYLEGLRDLPADLTEKGDQISRRLGPLVIEISRRPASDRLGLSHLIRRSDIDAYRSAVLESVSTRIRLVVDGPRAPYSFAAFAPRIGLS